MRMKRLLMSSPSLGSLVPLFFGVLTLLGVGGGCASVGERECECACAQVYVVRHAEKESGVDDPGLTPAGVARAEALAGVCARAGVVAVYTTEYRRTRETGAPAAARVGTVVDASFPAGEEERLAAHVRRAHVGERVLVVGHSNTVGRVVAGLGAGRPADLGEGEYDRLFVVTLHADGRATLERRRYGRVGR